MLPIVLDPRALRVGVAGVGAPLAGRLELLTEAGVSPSAIFEGFLPSAAGLAVLNILFVAGLDETTSRELAKAARRARVFVNVEDEPALCDFHVPAQVRRRDLLFTVSTGGRSPGLARVLREDIERRFGPEWEERASWRSQGASSDEISRRTRDFLTAKEWLA